MKLTNRPIVASVSVLLMTTLIGPGTAAATRSATVTRVIDGDTVEVTTRSIALDIRLLGVDTPETVHPTEPVECFGPEASAFTERRLEGKDIGLEFDVERLDRYERTLAYIWLDGHLFNRTLVRRGFATVLIYEPNDKYAAKLRTAEEKARAEKRGLWEACRGSDGGEGSGDGGTAHGKCDPSYPGVCIPPPPPDLDCSDVSHRDFQVKAPDPHGFDGDNDGIGCET